MATIRGDSGQPPQTHESSVGCDKPPSNTAPNTAHNGRRSQLIAAVETLSGFLRVLSTST